MGTALSYVRRRPELTGEAFQGYRKARPLYDGIAEVWFEDTAAMRASAASSEYTRVRADEPNFVAPDLPFVITREHVIVAP